ncbi:M23 family metallopeptidase [Glycomyces sp. L485]|uniref:peptidoglycan DD-metalloendopeptidase family protein n=1 Tax=Glycomyces sp. L485 TaxID=2909235 RepID=UPI001F4AD2FD|nr:M23 family metallopeptidase [Glycomyces sp. L485]MCH7231272.1 M23 family metallopeptidase [Glycomyces sp. L485]
MRRISLPLAALLLGVAASGPASGLPSQDELDAVEREKARMAAALEGASEEVAEAGQTLAETESRLPGAERAVDEAEGRIAAAEAIAAESQQDAEEAREALAAAEAEFEAAAAAVEEAREAQAEMLTAIYRGVELLTVDAILGADDMSQVVDGLSYFEFMVEGKNAAVEDVTLKRREAANVEAAASVAEAVAAEAGAEAEDALAAAEVRVDEAVAARAEVEQLVAERTDALAVAEAAEVEAEAEYERLEAESERLAEELRSASSSEGSSGDSSSDGESGSGFAVPVNGWKSSDFGWRRHPIYGTSRFHGGTDFAAGHGSTIYAADSGTVVHAGWSGSYGMLTCIGHGGGLNSCYAHQSSIWVSKGERVSRNEGIGAVGSTGASTGAHLHFEVRKGGERVNPLGYLPSCLCRLQHPN